MDIGFSLVAGFAVLNFVIQVDVNALDFIVGIGWFVLVLMPADFEDETVINAGWVDFGRLDPLVTHNFLDVDFGFCMVVTVRVVTRDGCKVLIAALLDCPEVIVVLFPGSVTLFSALLLNGSAVLIFPSFGKPVFRLVDLVAALDLASVATISVMTELRNSCRVLPSKFGVTLEFCSNLLPGYGL